MGQLIGRYSWNEVFSAKNADEKVNNFHETILAFLNHFFPQKRIKVSKFDKKWFNPELRTLHRKRQREFFKHGKSEKWLKLRRKFQCVKRATVRKFYENFSSDLLKSSPRKFFNMAKRIGSLTNDPKIMIQELEGCSSIQSAEKIAENFSKISNQ